MKRLTERQVMVYRLLRSLNGRASTLELIRLAKERHPQSHLYARVREQLEKLKAKGYLSRDKNRLPYVWVITEKLEEAQRENPSELRSTSPKSPSKLTPENVMVKLREKEVIP